MNPQRRSAGFTLVELLVVIAIIGVLVALLLPAVQAAREAARRMQCNNHLKQVGLGLHNRHDVHLRFPQGQYNPIGADPTPGSPWNRACWWHDLLPFVEQQPLYNALEAYTKATPAPPYITWSVNSDGNNPSTPGRNTVVKMFVCPSDKNGVKNRTVTGNEQGFHGNYVLCGGSTVFNPTTDTTGIDLNGLFYVYSKTRFADITDGSSNTLMGGEIMVVKDTNVHDLRGRYYNTWQGNNLFSTLYPPNTTVGDRSNYCINTREAPCQSLSGTDVVQSVRSFHPGGGNFLFGDGSVRFVTNAINLTTYQALGTRAGGEPLADF
jgi:prepilin-type N-terminal cleavage/methylation domain-containing protein/prepilin-type processing-associated H-X9-DG protein